MVTVRDDSYGGVPLAAQILILGHALAHVLDRRLARHGYNRTQAAIITTLHGEPSLMAQDLVHPVRVQPPNVTRALQALERRGLIERRPHPTDGRASLFQVTDAGREAAVTLDRLLADANADLEQAIPSEQLETLRQSLASLLSRVEQMRGAGI